MVSQSPGPHCAPRSPRTLAATGVAAVSTSVALAARPALDAIAPHTLPFPTSFPAIRIATPLRAWLAGTLTLVAGTLLVWYLVLPPRYSFAIESSGMAVSLLLFAATAGLMVAIADRFRRQNERLRGEA